LGHSVIRREHHHDLVLRPVDPGRRQRNRGGGIPRRRLGQEGYFGHCLADQ
jgi:hypothetical protein